jgi:hypothetical protein
MWFHGTKIVDLGSSWAGNTVQVGTYMRLGLDVSYIGMRRAVFGFVSVTRASATASFAQAHTQGTCSAAHAYG